MTMTTVKTERITVTHLGTIREFNGVPHACEGWYHPLPHKHTATFVLAEVTCHCCLAEIEFASV